MIAACESQSLACLSLLQRTFTCADLPGLKYFPAFVRRGHDVCTAVVKAASVVFEDDAALVKVALASGEPACGCCNLSRFESFRLQALPCCAAC